MVSLFTQTTVELTNVYVGLFTPQQLESKLSKVKSATGVQFSKAKTTYALTGTWEQVNDAFSVLQKWLDDPDREPREDGNASSEKYPEITKQDSTTTPKSCETEKLSPTDNLKHELKVNGVKSVSELKKKAKYDDSTKKNEKARQKTQIKKEDSYTKISIVRERVKTRSETRKTNPPKNKTTKKVQKKKILKEVAGQQTCDTNVSHQYTDNHKDHCHDSSDELSPSRLDNETPAENLPNRNNILKDNQHINVTVSPLIDKIKEEMMEKESGHINKKNTRKPGDPGYWSRIKIPDYNEKHKCTKCDAVLKSRKRYMEHLRRIHVKEFKCEVCKRCFGYPTDLNRHKCAGVADPTNEKKKKGGRPKKVKPSVFLPCPECDYIGTSRKRFNGHVRRTHRLIFACDQCDKMFGFKRDLQRHKDNVHAEPSHFCDKCSRMYKSKAVFEEHMKSHEEGYVKPTYECQVCAKTFATKYVLSTHVKTEHLGMKKTYLCQVCGKKFSQRNSYKQHSNAHAGIKPYGCDVCGKAFTYHKSLKEHKFMHDNIRRFQCQLCDKAFRQRTTLQIHMKVHKTIKDHICSNCGKGFSQKQALERHERIHTGVKPYTCIPCQRKFGDASTIRRHMLAIHQKNETNWREEIICSVKKKTDYYVIGGSGHNRTYKSSVKNKTDQPVKHELQQNKTLQDISVSGPESVLLISAQDQCSVDFKNEYTLSDLSSLQDPSGQLQAIQPGAIYAVATGVSQAQVLQNSSVALTGAYSSSTAQVIDFSSLAASQTHLLADKHQDLCSQDQHQLDLSSLHSTGTLQSMTLTPVAIVSESQRLAQTSGAQSSSSDAGILGQTVNNIWGLVGYPAYYNAPSIAQYSTQQSQQ